jgi:redox-sensitive bicupin YhaK (pirin superfamily)
MTTALHKAATRGHAHHGWLDSWHTFSFASYYDPSRVHFGALRVLNDDTVSGGMGFGKHPHDNMEIISIPLDGALEHADSLGNVQVIQKGDVQVMSAGTGVVHSEKNASATLPVKFLQIWVLPNQNNVSPRYAQQNFSDAVRHNKLVTVVSPMGETEGVNIFQDAWFSMGKLDNGTTLSYSLKKEGNGLYAFVIEGDITLNQIVLNRRDGLGITGEKDFQICANANSEILLMDVPVG